MIATYASSSVGSRVAIRPVRTPARAASTAPGTSSDGRTCLPLRDPRYALLTDSGRYHLTKDVGEGIELSREGVLLWAVAHGRSKEDALTEALRCYGVNGPAVAREEVSAYYDHIVAAGLLLGAGDDAHEDVRSAPDPSRV